MSGEASGNFVVSGLGNVELILNIVTAAVGEETVGFTVAGTAVGNQADPLVGCVGYGRVLHLVAGHGPRMGEGRAEDGA